MTNLLTAEQVAQLLAVSVKTVYKWAHAEIIPCYKFGKAIRFSREDIEAWVGRYRIRGRATRLKPVY